MPPLLLTQVKYALAMLAMSVNDVPGWLVTIPPSGIGVPVAFTPGLVPHRDVAVAVLLALLVAAEPLGDPLLLVLPHPAAAATAMTAASAAAPRARVFPPPRFAPAPTLGARSRVVTNPHLLVVRAGTKPWAKELTLPRHMTISESGVIRFASDVRGRLT